MVGRAFVHRDFRLPELRWTAHLLAVLGLLASGHVAAAALRLQVVDGRGLPVVGAIVTLQSLDPGRAPPAPLDALMDQKDRAFVPHVLVVPRGSRVSFPNSDTISHQVYSFSPVKRFQLPLYRGSSNPPVVFDKSGLVTLGCNIHDRMRGYVLVTDAQHFARTDALGWLTINDIPVGDYNAQVWHPHARDARRAHEQKLVLPAGAARYDLTLRLSAPLQLREPANRPSGWDAY
jgi:plastocyanin